jgi:hypothetical protein
MTGLVERVARAVGVTYRHGGIDVAGNDVWVEIPWDKKHERKKEVDFDMARTAIRAILETHAIVPKEPDDAMVLAGDNWAATTRQTYKAMLAAAPDPLKG